MNWGGLGGETGVGQRRLDISGHESQDSVVQPGIHGVRWIGRWRQATKVRLEAGRKQLQKLGLRKIRQQTHAHDMVCIVGAPVFRQGKLHWTPLCLCASSGPSGTHNSNAVRGRPGWLRDSVGGQVYRDPAFRNSKTEKKNKKPLVPEMKKKQ